MVSNIACLKHITKWKSIASDETITCNRMEVFYSPVGLKHVCYPNADLTISTEDTTLTIIHNMLEFNGLLIQSQGVHYLPTVFQPENLRLNFSILAVTRSSLGKITAESLKNFPELRVLDVSYNHIKYLEADLFHGNKELQYLDVSYNLIRIVHSSIFLPVNHIGILNFTANACATGNAKTKDEIKHVLNDIFNLCPYFHYEQPADYQEILKEIKSDIKGMKTAFWFIFVIGLVIFGVVYARKYSIMKNVRGPVRNSECLFGICDTDTVELMAQTAARNSEEYQNYGTVRSSFNGSDIVCDSLDADRIRSEN